MNNIKIDFNTGNYIDWFINSDGYLESNTVYLKQYGAGDNSVDSPSIGSLSFAGIYNGHRYEIIKSKYNGYGFWSVFKDGTFLYTIGHYYYDAIWPVFSKGAILKVDRNWKYYVIDLDTGDLIVDAVAEGKHSYDYIDNLSDTNNWPINAFFGSNDDKYLAALSYIPKNHDTNNDGTDDAASGLFVWRLNDDWTWTQVFYDDQFTGIGYYNYGKPQAYFFDFHNYLVRTANTAYDRIHAAGPAMFEWYGLSSIEFNNEATQNSYYNDDKDINTFTTKHPDLDAMRSILTPIDTDKKYILYDSRNGAGFIYDYENHEYKQRLIFRHGFGDLKVNTFSYSTIYYTRWFQSLEELWIFTNSQDPRVAIVKTSDQIATFHLDFAVKTKIKEVAIEMNSYSEYDKLEISNDNGTTWYEISPNKEITEEIIIDPSIGADIRLTVNPLKSYDRYVKENIIVKNMEVFYKVVDEKPATPIIVLPEDGSNVLHSGNHYIYMSITTPAGEYYLDFYVNGSFSNRVYINNTSETTKSYPLYVNDGSNDITIKLATMNGTESDASTITINVIDSDNSIKIPLTLQNDILTFLKTNANILSYVNKNKIASLNEKEVFNNGIYVSGIDISGTDFSFEIIVNTKSYETRDNKDVSLIETIRDEIIDNFDNIIGYICHCYLDRYETQIIQQKRVYILYFKGGIIK